MANEDQAKGKLKELEGKAQEAGGKLTDDKDAEAKGKSKQAEGKARDKLGDVKEGVKKALE